MTQLSLFSADLTPPRLEDLGGLLAAHGQVAGGQDGVRLSILLADGWRADALLRECRVRDVPSRTAKPEGPDTAVLLHTDRTAVLEPLATQWTRGAVKAVPGDISLTPGFLRCWCTPTAPRCWSRSPRSGPEVRSRPFPATSA